MAIEKKAVYGDEIVDPKWVEDHLKEIYGDGASQLIREFRNGEEVRLKYGPAKLQDIHVGTTDLF